MTTSAQNPLIGGALSAKTTIVVGDYLEWLDGETPANVYRMVIDEAERGAIEVMMNHCQGNQRLCAEVMGINRATLRDRLKRHNMI